MINKSENRFYISAVSNDVSILIKPHNNTAVPYST